MPLMKFNLAVYKLFNLNVQAQMTHFQGGAMLVSLPHWDCLTLGCSPDLQFSLLSRAKRSLGPGVVAHAFNASPTKAGGSLNSRQPR